MRQILISVVIFCLGGVAFWLLSPLLSDKVAEEQLDSTQKARLEAQRLVDEARAKEAVNNTNTEEINPSAPPVESVPYTNQNGEKSSVLVEGPFPIIGTPKHPATGQVEIIRSPEETLIQYKNYDGTNGPDLKIYLAKDLEAKEFISLGDARANQGNIIYGAPLDIDFTEYPYILTWCEAFGELFDYVKIN